MISLSTSFMPRRMLSSSLWAMAGVWLLACSSPCEAQPESFSPAQREAALAELRREGHLSPIVLELPLWSVPVAVQPATPPFELPSLLAIEMPLWKKPSSIRLSLVKLEPPAMPAPVALTLSTWSLPAPLSLKVVLARQIADEYASVGDERAAPYYEEVLADITEPQPGLVPELWNLASYYESVKDYRKAADTFARAEQYSEQPYFLGHSMINAAEMYRIAGDDKKADVFYARATEVGNGYDAGRALLLQAYSHYSNGSLDQANKYSRQALDRFQALEVPSLIDASRDFIEQAQTLLTYSETWRKEPIISKSREVRVKADEDVNFSDSLFTRFRVRTLRDVPLTATCDNPKVKVRIESDAFLNSARFKYFAEKQVIVEIPLIEAQKGFDTIVRVSSLDLKTEVQVPLHVEP